MRRLTVLLLIALTATGCHSPLLHSVDEATLVERDRHHLVAGLTVPESARPEACGAQALATVLAWQDPARDAGTLTATLPVPDGGATPMDLLVDARARGLPVTIARGDWATLAAAARAGRPSIVMLDARLEARTIFGPVPIGTAMHWSVVSGVARDDDTLLLAAPQGRHHIVRRADFERRWATSDCCTILLEPIARPDRPSAPGSRSARAPASSAPARSRPAPG